MTTKPTKPSDIRKLRKAFLMQYNSFQKKFHEVAEEANVLLGAMEQIIDWSEGKK